MAEKAQKPNKAKKTGLIIGICVAIIIVAAIIITATILIINSNNKLSDSYFVSDNSKYVLTLNSNDLIEDEDGLKANKVHIVYNYSGDDITGVKAYYLYENADTAKKAFDKITSANDGIYKDVSIDGNYVIITSNESDYSELTASDVKNQIELMESINNSGYNEVVESETPAATTDENVEPSPEVIVTE